MRLSEAKFARTPESTLSFLHCTWRIRFFFSNKLQFEGIIPHRKMFDLIGDVNINQADEMYTIRLVRFAKIAPSTVLKK